MTFKKVLVTGGAGFIGSHLVEALVSMSQEVCVLDNLSTGKMDNINHLYHHIKFITGDIRDMDLVFHASKDCDVIFHLAAVVSVPMTVENPIESAYVNEMGTLHVLDAARKNHVQRVILSSSSAVYGNNAPIPNQEDKISKPISPYALQKYIGELYASVYDRIYGIDTVCLRYFNVFGPRQDPSSPYSGVISIFMTKAATNAQPTIYGDGNQYRDFIFVKDVVKANLRAAFEVNVRGKAINIGTGRLVRINELWWQIAQIAGVSMSPKYLPPRKGDILESVADITLAKNILNFEPEYSFETGIAITYDWYRSHLK